MFKIDFKMIMSTANQFIDPNVYWSTILRFLKNVSLKKTETHFQQYSKKCNKLMDDSCFKAQKEFGKAKQGLVKFPDNMCSQIIFMNIKKQYKLTLCLSEKAFKEY